MQNKKLLKFQTPLLNDWQLPFHQGSSVKNINHNNIPAAKAEHSWKAKMEDWIVKVWALFLFSLIQNAQICLELFFCVYKQVYTQLLINTYQTDKM